MTLLLVLVSSSVVLGCCGGAAEAGGAAEIGAEEVGVGLLASHTTTVSALRCDLLASKCCSFTASSTCLLASETILVSCGVTDVATDGVFAWLLTAEMEDETLLSVEACFVLVATEEALVSTDGTDDVTFTCVSREALVCFCIETVVAVTLLSCEIADTDDVRDLTCWVGMAPTWEVFVACVVAVVRVSDVATWVWEVVVATVVVDVAGGGVWRPLGRCLRQEG